MRSALTGLLLAAFAAAPALAEGDAAAGEKAFAVCKACHQIGPGAKNLVGPELNGLIGRKAGTVAGYNYSPANKDSGITWDEAELQKYLANPQAVVKGTKMLFPGFKDQTDKINNVIAYLKTFKADGSKAE
jgi:cytochrome c